MFSTLTVTTAPSVSTLTTLTQLKADLNLDDSRDTFYTRVIEICSDEISAYLRQGWDEDENMSLGRATVSETFYDLAGAKSLRLSRWPIAEITSIREGTTTTSRLLSGTDGAISSGDNTFTSATGPGENEFTDSYVGKTIVVTGAGAAGADLTTTIASVTSATEVELTAAASTTVSDASYTVVNPAFSSYIVKKQFGEIRKISGTALTQFLTDPVTVIYTCGWLMPGEEGRTLPKGIEDACILFARCKIDQLEEGEDFSGPLTGASIEGVGSFQFGGGSSRKGYGIPFEVRAMLDRYMQPVFA